MKPIFNYIITIHNKEDLIEEVINSVLRCSNENSFIYPILDGCIDKSEEIIDKIIIENPNASIFKIKMNDVHEILSINEGLRVSNQLVEGYNIILQDDVILKDFDIESKICQLYSKVGSRLGYVSFRLGANLKNDILYNKESSLFVDFIESAYGHGISNSDVLLPGQFAFRDIAIKSPVCIPTKIINEFGLLDENLAPCFHDDTEYSIRLLKRGFKNGVFSLNYESDLDWGSTREKPNPKYSEYITKNLLYIKTKYKVDIIKILSAVKEKEVIIFKEFFVQDEIKKALKNYKLNKLKVEKYIMRDLSILGKCKYRISKTSIYNFLKKL
jgi:hypothetical protein